MGEVAAELFRALDEGEYGSALALVATDADTGGEDAALAACARGACWLYLGRLAQARAELSSAFELSARLAVPGNQAQVAAVAYLGLLALYEGHPHEAREQFAAAQVVERSRRRRLPWLNVTWGLGEALLGWGPAEYERCARQLAMAAHQAAEENNRGDLLEIHTSQANLMLRQGQPTSAAVLLERDEEIRIGVQQRAPAIYRRRAALWLSLGRQAESTDTDAFALDLTKRRSATIKDEALRQAYLAAQQADLWQWR